jgi:hypothetical protein
MRSDFFDSDQNSVFVHLRFASIVVLISESRIRKASLSAKKLANLPKV